MFPVPLLTVRLMEPSAALGADAFITDVCNRIGSGSPMAMVPVALHWAPSVTVTV